MSPTVSRPRTGLSPDAALKHWSNERAYAELVALSGQPEPPAVEDAHRFIRNATLEAEYSRKREAVEAAFKQKLYDAEILASGISTVEESRKIIHPSLWELLSIDYSMFGDANGENRKYEKLEFFERSAIPLNVRAIPEWLAEELAACGMAPFRNDPTYKHVWLNGIQFTLGPLQAKIVKLLHQAALTDDPWRTGKEILSQAGSTQSKLVDVFKSRKDWQLLIESDGRGMYRLRIDSAADRDS
jgi:hypothetical protein